MRMNVFTNVWKNPYTYTTKKGEIGYKMLSRRKQIRKKAK